MTLSFGIPAHAAPSATAAQVTSLIAEIGRRAGVPLEAALIEGYDELALRLGDGSVHAAWLPPIPFLALERASVVTPLVSHVRGGQAKFEAVLVVRRDDPMTTLYGLRGRRAAWVETLSAAGFVIPRIQLAALGLEPRGLFAEERFHGSHEAALRAVAEGRADVAGTFASVDASGDIVRGGWSDVPDLERALRVCARFGAIPADVTAARVDLEPAVRDALAAALVLVSKEERARVRSIFGVDELALWAGASYEPLRRALTEAADRGMFDP